MKLSTIWLDRLKMTAIPATGMGVTTLPLLRRMFQSRKKGRVDLIQGSYNVRNEGVLNCRKRQINPP
jgi:hypothetical protein